MKMNYLLFATIVGYLCWMASEVVEMIHGSFQATGFYLTAAFHLFSGIGIWGLHLVQSSSKKTLSTVGTVMISLSYLALVHVPIQVLNSGLMPEAFIEAYPLYMIPGLINVLGLIVFGIAAIKTKFFPAWTGIVIILGSLIFFIAMTNGFQIIANINNIILSMTFIYMGVLGLKALAKNIA